MSDDDLSYEQWWSSRPRPWRAWQRVWWYLCSVGASLCGRPTPGERLAKLVVRRVAAERDEARELHYAAHRRACELFAKLGGNP